MAQGLQHQQQPLHQPEQEQHHKDPHHGPGPGAASRVRPPPTQPQQSPCSPAKPWGAQLGEDGPASPASAHLGPGRWQGRPLAHCRRLSPVHLARGSPLGLLASLLPPPPPSLSQCHLIYPRCPQRSKAHSRAQGCRGQETPVGQSMRRAHRLQSRLAGGWHRGGPSVTASWAYWVVRGLARGGYKAAGTSKGRRRSQRVSGQRWRLRVTVQARSALWRLLARMVRGRVAGAAATAAATARLPSRRAASLAPPLAVGRTPPARPLRHVRERPPAAVRSELAVRKRQPLPRRRSRAVPLRGPRGRCLRLQG